MSNAVSASRGTTRGRTRAGRVGRGALALLVALGLTGCNGGIHWQGPTFTDAYAAARRAHKLTFVYFRSWYLVECTDFEEKTLKNPEVLAETRNMVCCVLDYDWDRPLAQQWRLKSVPAFAILAPTGDLLARQAAPITREELLRAIRSAKNTFESGILPTTQAAAPPS
jgi:hypothetical protein